MRQRLAGKEEQSEYKKLRGREGRNERDGKR